MNIRDKAPLRLSFAGGGTDIPPYPQELGGDGAGDAMEHFAQAISWTSVARQSCQNYTRAVPNRPARGGSQR